MSVTIGVDIGGTKIAGGIVGADGAILARSRKETERDPRQVVATIVDVVQDLVEVAGREGLGDVEAVGLGAPGFVDETRRVVRFAPNIDWAEEPLADAVSGATGLPAIVENDANAAAWGEFRFGAGRDAHDLVAVTVGTGIGGGIVLGDRLVRGAYGMAAEFGHLVRVPDGRLCGCGKRGCWEQYASGNALLRKARELAAERRNEAHTLLSLGDGTPEGIDGLMEATASDLHERVRAAAAEALGRLGVPSPEVARRLLHLLSEESLSVRRAAAGQPHGLRGWQFNQRLCDAAQHSAGPAMDPRPVKLQVMQLSARPQ